MHPLLSNPRRLAVYLLSWVPFAWFVGEILDGAGLRGFWTTAGAAGGLALLCAFLALSAAYSNRLAPLRSSSPGRVLAVQLGAASLTVGLWLALGAAALGIVEVAAGRDDLIDPFTEAAPLLAGVGGIGFAISAVIHYLETAARQQRDAERRALELQVAAREAELKTLRAQIDPHFLFNSLHSIGALTLTDPAAARRMCVLLGDFLRTSLKVGHQPFIPLADEIALARGYLAIEQVRLGSRLSVHEAVDDAARQVPVPPLLLQPLVENAITHGIGQLVDGGGVAIDAATRDGRVHIVVASSRDPDSVRRPGTGLGLPNVRRRLESAYDHAASLTVRELDDRFEVEIIVPARQVKAPGM